MKIIGKFSPVHSLSLSNSATPWTAACQASLSITNSRSSLKLMPIKLVMPSHPLSSPSPPALNLSQQKGLFKWVSSFHQVAMYWSFSFSISPSNQCSGLISFRMVWLDLLAVQGTLSQESSPTILQCSAFLIVQLSHPYMTTEQTIALTTWAFVGTVMSLLFNISRLVITFLPRSKHLNFMAAVIICSDFGTPQNKVYHCFHCFPIYLPWSDGTGCHDPSFLNVEF